jgi:glycosyltransferase domain-containing protein
MEYFHMPEKRFDEKILFALKETTTDLVVMCADDDFILINALYNGSDYLKNNKNYKTVVGKYVGFNQKFDDTFFPIYQKLPIDIDFGYEMNSETFFRNYYQILWSMSHKEVLTKAFQIVNQVKFQNDNFIELIIGACACYEGGIKFLDRIWGVREQSTVEHWGSHHTPITNMKIANKNGDFMKFSEIVNKKTHPGYAEKILTNYLAGQKKQNHVLRKLVSKLIPWGLKKYVKQKILSRKTKNTLSLPKDIELERLRSILSID